MKHTTAPVLLALLCLSAGPSAVAQNLPAAMAITIPSAIRNFPANGEPKLLITGNSLIPAAGTGIDLGKIPAEPEAAFRISRDSSSGSFASKAQSNLEVATTGEDNNTIIARIMRTAALLVALTIAFVGNRKLADPRPTRHLSDLRNFPKKRLAHREAHA